MAPAAAFAVLFAGAAGLKLLLLPAYTSTDFEVHRHWMALTRGRPLSQWYHDETSEWTLDYPPLFAWFERALAAGAARVDPAMLILSAEPYSSAATVAYQRGTVILTDVVLLLGATSLARATARAARGEAESAAGAAHLLPAALAFLDAGLLLVDHVHFQYNGFLIGLLLLATADLVRGRPLRASLAFATLLNLKHLFLFAAPFFSLHLLADHVLAPPPTTTSINSNTASATAAGTVAAVATTATPNSATPNSVSRSGRAGLQQCAARLCALGCVVLLVFSLSLGPFAAQLPQLLKRLFPFDRGLVHAYWAPNTWALYVAADKALAAAARWAGVLRAAAAVGAATGGVVGEAPMALLPAVRPAHAAALVLLLQAPVLLGSFARPSRRAAPAAIVYCGLAAFLAGYHVHEKALLPPLVLLAAAAPTDATGAALHARLLLLLSAAAHYAVLPLLHRPAELLLSRALPLLYHALAREALRARLAPLRPGAPLLRPHEWIFLAGLLPLECFVSLAHPLLVAPRLPFLPLLATSVYCAICVHYCAALALALWRQQRLLPDAGAEQRAPPAAAGPASSRKSE